MPQNDEEELAQITLNSIGDAVISTDVQGRVTFLNAVAERLTGWASEEAIDCPMHEVLRLVDTTSGEAASDLMTQAMREDRTVSLAPHCSLIRRDGTEMAIEDSVAPIRNRFGEVTGAVIVFRDVTAARAQAQRLSYLAQHDGLTNLPNRMLLNERLAAAIALAQRYERKLALLYLDVDRFKHINDSLGHMIGDRLLQSVAQRLLSCVRASDMVSRHGGDEFAVLLSEVSHAEDAAVSADKILIALRRPHHIDHHDLYVSGSIGIVTYPHDGSDAEALLKNADFAMYHAKDSGRDQYQFFTPQMHGRAFVRHTLEQDLRVALEREEFVLYYQPRIDLATGAMVGVEALIRWRHPERGLVPPAQFIPLAEDCGFIVPVGRWVLRQACRQALAWQEAGAAPLRIAINVSMVELRARDFVAGVQAILAETNLAPQYLELELTETFLMRDSLATGAVLQTLNAIGVHLTLDDFGTGYSSLSHLRHLPIDTLKIDQSFVRNMTADADDASIVSALVHMGGSLQMRVVAEGVETREQLAFLRAHSCPEGQGYYFSPPLPAPEFNQLRITPRSGQR